MFRRNPAIIRFTSKGYQGFVTTMRLCKDGEISSSRFKYVIIKFLIIEDENITTCFGLIRPSSGLHPKSIRDL